MIVALGHHDPPGYDEAYFGLSPARPAENRFIPAERLGNSDYCGACHTEIYQQWAASSHHFSSFNNPFYRRVALVTLERRGRNVLTLCAGCHDPLPLLSGELDRLDLKGWTANAGITCLACHRIAEVHGGNGAYTLSAPSLDNALLAGSPLRQKVHDSLIAAMPSLHRRAFAQTLYATAEYCGACHEATVPAVVNGRRSVAVQSDHTEWLHSRYSTHSVEREGGRTCVECHMPLVESGDPSAKDGRIRSHRFPGGNTALPTLNRDHEQLAATEGFLKSGAPALAIRVEWGRPPARWAETPRNRELRIEVEVGNYAAGHGFPAGTAESNEAWLELKVQDARGRELFSRGTVDGKGHVDRDADFFRAVFTDAAGRTTGRANTSTDAVARSAGTRLGPGAKRRIVYAVPLPGRVRYPLQARVRLNWRKFSPDFTEWTFAGRSAVGLPITVLNEVATEIRTPAASALGHQGRASQDGSAGSQGGGR